MEAFKFDGKVDTGLIRIDTAVLGGDGEDRIISPGEEFMLAANQINPVFNVANVSPWVDQAIIQIKNREGKFVLDLNTLSPELKAKIIEEIQLQTQLLQAVEIDTGESVPVKI